MASGNTAIFEPHRVAAGSNSHELVELCLGYALILVVIWTPRPWQRVSSCAAAIYLVTVLWNSWPGWKAVGLRPAKFTHSLWLIGVALVLCAIAIVVARQMQTLHTPGGPRMFLARYTGYAIGACIQQVLLQNLFLPRLLRLMRGPGSAALITAAMFSLAHLPNSILTVITFFWGLTACLFFLRYRNLYTLAVAHIILGITVAMTIPGPAIHNMRVGFGYLSYLDHRGHPRSH